ncbi:MAG: hypothetical protein Q8L48_41460 [Archangium sp.]|nr:hypothetical protein [Archangium sp.]
MTPLLDEPGLAIFECPGLIVILMRSSPDDAAFIESGARVREVLTRQPRINVLILIPNFDGRARASRATQAAFATLLGDLHEHLVGTCITITVPGLKGTMLRMAVNAVLMLGKLRNPIQLHGSVPATLAWLKSLPGQVPGVLDAPNLAWDLERLLPAR